MFADPMAPVKALEELKAYMQTHGVEKVSDLTGAVIV